MDRLHHSHNVFHMVRRTAAADAIAAAIPVDEVEQLTAISPPMPNGVVGRAATTTVSTTSLTSSTCTANNNSAECEKPIGSNTYTIPIACGIA